MRHLTILSSIFVLTFMMYNQTPANAKSKLIQFKDAVIFDNIKKAKHLIDKGVDINTKTFNGKTALMHNIAI